MRIRVSWERFPAGSYDLPIISVEGSTEKPFLAILTEAGESTPRSGSQGLGLLILRWFRLRPKHVELLREEHECLGITRATTHDSLGFSECQVSNWRPWA